MNNKDFYKFSPFSVLILILGTFAVFSSSLYFDFFLIDDDHHIMDNERLRLTFENFKWYWANSNIPVVFNVWQILGFLFGYDNPTGFRVANILVHCLNGILLFKILEETFKKVDSQKYAMAPLVVSALFLFHPMQVESVVWISSFRGTLAALFMFLSVLVFISKEKLVDYKKEFLIIVLCLLGVLCKPIVGTIPLLFLSMDLFIKKLGRRSISQSYTIILFLGLFLYFFTVVVPKSSMNITIGIEQKFFVTLNSFSFYVQKFFLPFSTNSLYGVSLESVVESLTSGIFIAALSLFSFAVIFLTYQAVKKENWLFLSGLGIFLLFFIPTSGLISYHFQVISTVADRYMYLPSIGLGLITIDLWRRISRFLSPLLEERKLRLIPYVFFSLMIITTFRQVNLWEDSINYLEQAQEDNANSFHIQLALGIQNIENGRFDKAVVQLKKSLALKPSSPEPLIFLMKNYARSYQIEKARVLYNSVSKTAATEIPMMLHFADALINTGNYFEAENLLNRYEIENPYNEEIRQMNAELRSQNNNRYLLSLQRILKENSLELSEKVRANLTKRVKLLLIESRNKTD